VPHSHTTGNQHPGSEGCSGVYLGHTPIPLGTSILGVRVAVVWTVNDKIRKQRPDIIKVLWCGATTCRVSDIHSMWCSVVRFSPAVLAAQCPLDIHIYNYARLRLFSGSFILSQPAQPVELDPPNALW